MQQDPRTRVSAPAVGLIVTGALGVVTTLILLVMVAFGGLVALVDKDSAESLPGIGITAIWMLVGLVVSVFVIYAGLQMRKLQGWGLSMAGAILAMIPCISPCCLLGLPIGVWAVLVLIDEEVKRSFDTGGAGPSFGGPAGGFGAPPTGPSGPYPGDPGPPPPPGDAPRPPSP